VLATLAAAYLGVEGQGSLSDEKLAEALALAPKDWMKDSTVEQVNKLKKLLSDSPLKKLPAGGTI
jgi:hypothetical protein